MDREKVIKALQNCSVQNDEGCQVCPYFEERKTYGHEWCTTSMAQDTIALLKEQEELIKAMKRDLDSVRSCKVCGNWTECTPDDRQNHRNSKCGVTAVAHANLTGHGEVSNFRKGADSTRKNERMGGL